jgi:uncharacterized protein with HEPN domain
MPHRTHAWLIDIQTCINNIEEFMKPKRDFFEYQQNKLVRHAIERNLITIGEAINRILTKDPTIAITHARAIVNLRNQITHGYDEVSDERIWAILCNYLPLLKEEVNHLIENN